MNENNFTFFIHFVGISGYVGVDLRPVAVACVRLFSGDTELRVSGPVQISLSVPDSPGLQASSVIPAWFFNQTTGELCSVAEKEK